MKGGWVFPALLGAWVFLVLLVVALVIAGSIQASPPPHRISAQREHQRVRLIYLAQGCYPLDYWHVICPMPAP